MQILNNSLVAAYCGSSLPIKKLRGKEIINSDLVDQLSNSDDNSLSIDDRHAQNTPDGFSSALHQALFQPASDVADVEDLTRCSDVSRNLSQGAR